MRVEINPRIPGSDELVVDLREDELQPALNTDAKVAEALAKSAGELAAQLAAGLSKPPEQMEAARRVRCFTIRVLRTEIVAEISIPVPDGEDLWVQ
jgi:hypothetical protein